MVELELEHQHIFRRWRASKTLRRWEVLRTRRAVVVIAEEGEKGPGETSAYVSSFPSSFMLSASGSAHHEHSTHQTAHKCA